MSQSAVPAPKIKPEKDFFVDMVIDDDKDLLEPVIDTPPAPFIIPPPANPDRYSVQWSKYVMEQFDKSELQDGNPTCDGVRRIFQLLIGPILARDTVVEQVPTIENGGRSTIKCIVSYIDRLDGYNKVVSDVADCWKGNTEQPYSSHPTATASTMAEGRALRKGLGLSALLKEEKSKADPITAQEANIELDSKNGISDAQKTVIRKLVKDQGLSLERTLAYFNGKEVISSPEMDSLSSDEARKLIQETNRFGKDAKANGVVVPEELILTITEKTAKDKTKK